MELKTESLATADRSTPSAKSNLHANPERTARNALQLARLSKGASARAGEMSLERSVAPSSELDDRIQGLADAIAEKERVTPGHRDAPALREQARLTASQIRSDARIAWSAQAHISPRSALALLKG